MHWKAKYTRTDYADGATRLKRAFAWLPIYIEGDIIWLQGYEILQVYKLVEQKVIIDAKETIFVNGNWQNLSKRWK